MKNLMIFVHPSKEFEDYHWGDENKTLAKVQIENSLELGWKKEDIVIITNFDYQHMGVKAKVFKSELFCKESYTATKMKVMLHLLEKGFIGNDLWWFHDFDAFQLEEFGEKEIALKKHPFSLTDYGKTTINAHRDRRWSTGSIFFNNKSQYIFKLIMEKVYQYKANEEVCLLLLTNMNKQNLNKDINKLNITYNLATRKRDIVKSYQMANKPLKVIHFHPYDERPLDLEDGKNNVEVVIRGKGRLKKPLVTNRLKKIFAKYAIK